jgi:hypothetical protein
LLEFHIALDRFLLQAAILLLEREELLLFYHPVLRLDLRVRVM